MSFDPFRRNERGCRCGTESTQSPAGPPSVPEGHCGRCEVCGGPGHNRFFPGVLPFRGTWCDSHYERLRHVHPCGAVGVVYWTIAGWTVLLTLLTWGVAQ